jgi:hypothetical protein
MRKRRYIRPFLGMALIFGLTVFTVTDALTKIPNHLVVLDLQSLFFIIFFAVVYSLMVDDGRSLNPQSIGLGALYGGYIAFLLGIALASDQELGRQPLPWARTVLPLLYGILIKIFADSLVRAKDPEKQLKLF